MSKQLPNPGAYTAVTTGAMVIKEADTGSLTVQIPCKITNGDVAWSGKHTATLINRDGEAKERTIADLAEIFGVDFGTSDLFFVLQDVEAGQHEFEVVLKHEEARELKEGERELRWYAKVEWMNVLGKGGGVNMPEPLDAKGKKDLLTKFSRTFKAIAGGGQAPAAASTKPAAKITAKPTPATTPSRPAAAASSPARKTTGAQKRTATQDEVWEAYRKGFPDIDETEATTNFWAAADEIAGEGATPTIQQWGAVADKLGV